MTGTREADLHARVTRVLDECRSTYLPGDQAALVLAELAPELAGAESVRTAALNDAAAALQVVIDQDRSRWPRRSNDRITLCGAREIVLSLINGKRRGGVVTPRISAVEQDAWLALVARIGYSAAQRAWPVVSATLTRARAESTAKEAS